MIKNMIVAIVGRTNVGKSSLFNALTRTKDALVYDAPGVTRDRQYAQAVYQDLTYTLIDTGGLSQLGFHALDDAMVEQTQLAIDEADLVIFMLDAKEGLTPVDEMLSKMLRQKNKMTFAVVNKCDHEDHDTVLGDFYTLGFSDLLAVSVSHRRGLKHLQDLILQYARSLASEDDFEDVDIEEETKGIRFALIGKPNVGKSTLTNRLIGEDRVIVYDMPGTTRDSIYIPFQRQEQDYTVIDTAGIRRRKSVGEGLEKFSIVKTLKAINDAHVCVMMMDAREGVTDQDLSLLGYIIHSGRALVIAINKWDGMEEYDKAKIKEDLDRRAEFAMSFADVHYISALHGSSVGHLFASIHQAYTSATKVLKSSELTAALKLATDKFVPPRSGQFRIKPKFAHIGGHLPPNIVIHGNQVSKLPGSYQRYLMKHFMEIFELKGTPIKLVLQDSENPFKDKPSKAPTERMQKKQVRLMKRSNKTSRRGETEGASKTSAKMPAKKKIRSIQKNKK